MPLDEDLWALLLRGSLHPRDAARALMGLLAPYSLDARREIIYRLSDLADSEPAIPFGEMDTETTVGLRDIPTEPELVRTDLLSRLWELRRNFEAPTVGQWEIDERLMTSTKSAQLIKGEQLIRVTLDTEALEFPMFQFERAHNEPSLLEVRAPVAAANRVLVAGTDPWGALGWWVTPNGYLDGRPPAVIVEEPLAADAVVEAARDVAA